MGYSIAFRTRSTKLHSEMLEFMKKNYRNWPTVAGEPDGNAYAGGPSDDLSYDKAKSAIGLDYGAVSGWERVYAYAIVRWMAIKIGTERRSFPNVTPRRTKAPVPFMVYDGYEAWPIIVVDTTAALKRLPQDSRWCAYTPLGMYASPLRYMEGELVIELSEDFDQMFKEVHEKIGVRGPDTCPKAHAAWVEKRHKLMMPHCRKKLREGLKPFKAEMQRLDKLWNAQ